jgi:hypothetical protein
MFIAGVEHHSGNIRSLPVMIVAFLQILTLDRS